MTQSALNAGYAPSTAHAASSLIEPGSRVRIAECLEQSGAANPQLAMAIVNALSANKAVNIDGVTELHADHRIRLDAVRLALEAKGELKSGATVAVQINFPPGLAEMLAGDMAGDK